MKALVSLAIAAVVAVPFTSAIGQLLTAEAARFAAIFTLVH